jgi:hypothetical protein
MGTINALFEQAELAEAAYANFVDSSGNLITDKVEQGDAQVEQGDAHKIIKYSPKTGSFLLLFSPPSVLRYLQLVE